MLLHLIFDEMNNTFHTCQKFKNIHWAIYIPNFALNPIPTGHGRNQPIYERHVTKSGRNRVKQIKISKRHTIT